MSLTQTHDVFVSASEGAINTFLTALFTARPNLLNYGSSAFVPSTTVAATNMESIPFPGIPGGIQWAVQLTVPKLDLFPDSSGGTSPLPPVANTFNLHTTATICIGCANLNSDPKGQRLVEICTQIELWALGEIVPHYFGPGTGFISFQVDEVLLPGITPETLETLLECLLRMILTAVLEKVTIPFHVLSLGAFQLALEEGPEINNNEVEVWGSI